MSPRPVVRHLTHSSDPRNFDTFDRLPCWTGHGSQASGTGEQKEHKERDLGHGSGSVWFGVVGACVPLSWGRCKPLLRNELPQLATLRKSPEVRRSLVYYCINDIRIRISSLNARSF